MGIFDPPPLLFIFCHFFFNLPFPYVIHYKVTNYDMKQKRTFFFEQAYHIISKELGKVRNCIFKLCVDTLLNIDTDVLTIHIAKILESQFFGFGNIAISDSSHEIQRNKNRVVEEKHGKTFSELHHLLCCTPSPNVTFRQFFSSTFLPPSWVVYPLNSPLGYVMQFYQTCILKKTIFLSR